MYETQGPWLSQNWNTFASSLLVQALHRLGVTAWFVSPGYRDAPIIAALQVAEGLTITSCWDERAGAYQALGYAKATGLPAVLVCTSGTAGANYLPALIEAKVDQIPIIVITADRPFDLVYAAAQQVIDQRQLFGRFVKQSLDFPMPSAQLNPASWLSYVRMLVNLSLEGPAGPVHFNLPFPSPLDPVQVADRPSDEIVAQTCKLLDSLVFRSNTCTRMLDELNVRALREEIQAAQRGLIIIGRLQERSEKRAAALIAERLDWPCFLDINSGLKACLDNEILDPSYPLIRQELESYKPDFVLHLGRRLVSRFFDEYIHRHQPKSYWVVSKEEGIQDPSHLPQRQQLNCSLSLLSDTIPKNYGRTTPAHQSLLAASEKAREALLLNSSLEFCFAAVAQTIVSLLPKRRHGLFLGNSTAIRAFDSWCDLRSGRVSDIEANRGVSGIEGLLATTLGLVLGSDHAWTTVLGDISLIHDLNSVLSIPRAKHPVILVVVNNSGGRIFENLPLKAHHWVKDPLITTPHDYSFVGLAQMAGIDYHLCLDQMSFTKVYAEAIQTGRSWIIECQQDPLADQRFSQRFQFQETAP